MDSYIGYDKLDLLKMLPPEISQCILQYLNYRDIVSASTASKTWYKLTNCEAVWHSLCSAHCVNEEYIGFCPESDVIKTLHTMCHSKSLFYRYMQITKRWRNNWPKSITVDLPLRFEVICAAFHGSTLVVGLDNNTVLIYKTLRRKSFSLAQILSELSNYDGCDITAVALDSRVLVVKFGDVIMVYKLVENSYEMAYFLLNNDDNNCLRCYHDLKVLKTTVRSYFRICTGEDNFIILGNILYIKIVQAGKVYMWDLQNEKMVGVVLAPEYFFKFEDTVYVVHAKGISSFDVTGQSKLEISVSAIIKQIYVNKNILLATTFNHVGGKKTVQQWNRKTGKEIALPKINWPLDLVLHPLYNFIIYLNHSVTPRVWTKWDILALSLHDGKSVYRVPIKCPSVPILPAPSLEFVVNRWVLIHCPGTSVAPQKIIVFDSLKGQLLYSIGPDIQFSYILSHFFMWSSSKKNKLRIRFY